VAVACMQGADVEMVHGVACNAKKLAFDRRLSVPQPTQALHLTLAAYTDKHLCLCVHGYTTKPRGVLVACTKNSGVTSTNFNFLTSPLALVFTFPCACPKNFPAMVMAPPAGLKARTCTRETL